MPGTISVQTGHGGTALTAIVPQPHFVGIRYPQDTFTPDAIYEDGEPFGVLKWKSVTAAQLGTLYTRFGLTSVKYANVTISLPGDDRTTMTSYNAQAEKVRS